MLDRLERYRYPILAAMVAVLIAGVMASRSGGSPPTAIRFQPGPQPVDGQPIRVQVDGAVMTPGVFDLAAGDRLIDALDAAGGTAEGADFEALNLARPVRDGEKIVVAGSRARTDSVVAIGLTPAGPLDLNLATESQLQALPGIGEAYSRRIVDSRTVDGPFASLDDLLTRDVLPRATFEKIRHLVTAGP